MNETKIKRSTNEGWAVHVYDSARHLRFTLEPSHIWAFGWGIGVGLVTAFIWSGLHSLSHGFSSNTDPRTDLLPTSQMGSEANSRAAPASSIPLGMD